MGVRFVAVEPPSNYSAAAAVVVSSGTVVSAAPAVAGAVEVVEVVADTSVIAAYEFVASAVLTYCRPPDRPPRAGVNF